ncbi:MAG: hypothetical protein EOO10_15485 [Chitinophagaceae bacterium]|nr:MAG: hypothetical protein EOO10_15485 [Chitinophagaceae bacterium]
MNQNPEQLARDRIDEQLTACGRILKDKKSINIAAGLGITIRECQTDEGPADYMLFVYRKPVGHIEAKWDEEILLTMHDEQSTEYASAKFKYINNYLLLQEIESRPGICDKIEETIK